MTQSMMRGKTLSLSSEMPLGENPMIWKLSAVKTPVPIMLETTNAAAGQVETACLTGDDFTRKGQKKMPSRKTGIKSNLLKIEGIRSNQLGKGPNQCLVQHGDIDRFEEMDVESGLHRALDVLFPAQAAQGDGDNFPPARLRAPLSHEFQARH